MRWLYSVLLSLLLAGCGSATPAVDDTPFREAIGGYLETRNMAMKIKETKQGPTVQGDTASLRASLIHAQLEGPSVTWVFHFQKQPDGSWRVTGHED
jgi:hypothetical protein